MSQVDVGGASSRGEPLENMVYQGTVLGPLLWNAMYEDSQKPMAAHKFTEVVYADDLNGYRIFPRNNSQQNALGEHGQLPEGTAQLGHCESSNV